jgi:hypothetical protein
VVPETTGLRRNHTPHGGALSWPSPCLYGRQGVRLLCNLSALCLLGDVPTHVLGGMKTVDISETSGSFAARHPHDVPTTYTRLAVTRVYCSSSVLRSADRAQRIPTMLGRTLKTLECGNTVCVEAMAAT